MTPAYISQQHVRFGHCDAAGIIFYPRAFELLNAAMEDYLASLGYSYKRLHGPTNRGVPMVDLHVQFKRPLELDDKADYTIYVTGVGRTSVNFVTKVMVEGAEYIRATYTVVFMDLTSQKAAAWPEDLRAAFVSHEGPAP